MTVLLQISWRMSQWRNFENLPVFDEVMCRYVGLLFWPTLYMCYTDVPATESLTKHECCAVPFSRVTFSVRLRRKPTYYVINLLVPTIMFSVLTLISLTLQPGCSERIGLGLYIVFKPITSNEKSRIHLSSIHFNQGLTSYLEVLGFILFTGSSFLRPSIFLPPSSSFPFPSYFPSLPFHFLPLDVGPLNTARGYIL